MNEREQVSRRKVLRGGLALVSGGALGALPALPVLADDWPQWRGPRRTGHSAEKGWLARWPATGPRRLWSARVGEGYSSVAVAGGRLYTLGNSGGKDSVVCLSADTGKVLWRSSYPCGGGDYSGPRATPDVDGGNVYTLSREGLALCLDAVNGKVIWRNDLRRSVRAALPRWGFAGSPLVFGNRVIYNVGTHGTALDKKTGKLLWQTGGGAAGYASPVAFARGKEWAIAIFAATALVGINPANGRRIWEHPWRTEYDVNAADPLFNGDQVFISSGYNHGCAMLRLEGVRPRVLWENRNMRNHFNGSVLVGGHLYGNDDGRLKCLDARTGQERWQSRGMDKGGLIAADGKLIVLTGRGELVLAAAAPQRYSELARAHVLRGQCWTHPVLANGRIYCRSHEGELVCLDVRSG